MVYDPRSVDDIYTSLKSNLTGKISALTNFLPSSFNYVWTRAFSTRFRENEVALLASQLSSYIDYAGGPLTEEDIDNLGLTDVTASEVNEYLDDEDLDELVAILGVTRDPGEKATGSVDITTVSASTTIPEGTEFGTQPDSSGNFLSFFTTEEVTAGSGTTSVSANIQAAEVGSKYNVGANEITYLVDPPTGVNAVTNPNATTNGEDEETNDELRKRAKNSVTDQSGGGTVAGIEGFIKTNVDGVISVKVEEFVDGGSKQSAPYSDVIVDGGTNSAVQDAIDDSKPSGVKHYLVRPTVYKVAIDADVEGGSIDTLAVEDDLIDYLNELEIGDDVFRDKVIQVIMNADPDIDNIDKLDISIVDDTYTFSAGTDVYSIDKVMENDGITEVTGTLNGTSGHTFVEDTDYQEIDNNSDGQDDSIDWSLSGDDPDDGTDFFVDYLVLNDISITNRQKAEPATMTVTDIT